MLEHLYYYEAELIRCIDADTAWFHIDRGFKDFSLKSVRLARIDAFEIYGTEKEKGVLALDYTKKQYAKAVNIIIKSVELDGFGRAIAEVYLKINNEWRNLSDDLVVANHAIYKQY